MVVVVVSTFVSTTDEFGSTSSADFDGSTAIDDEVEEVVNVEGSFVVGFVSVSVDGVKSVEFVVGEISSAGVLVIVAADGNCVVEIVAGVDVGVCGVVIGRTESTVTLADFGALEFVSDVEVCVIGSDEICAIEFVFAGVVAMVGVDIDVGSSLFFVADVLSSVKVVVVVIDGLVIGKSIVDALNVELLSFFSGIT